MTYDEQRMQKALREIRDIADSVQGGEDRFAVYTKIGLILGIARAHGDVIKVQEAA